MNINEQLGDGIVKYALKYLQGEEFQKRMKIDKDGEDKMYRSGFIQGMLWCATLVNYFLKNGEFFTINNEKEKDK